MPIREHSGYSAIQISLHWIIAALVMFQLVFGEAMSEAVEAVEHGEQVDPSDLAMSAAHYWVGLVILGLVVVRVVVRLRRGPVGGAGAGLSDMAAHGVHALFYVLLVLVPVSGLLALYVSPALGAIHALAKPLCIVLILVHAGAALWHHFVIKDKVMARMLRPEVEG